MNQWESIGINYCIINWFENPNQILFDKKDEIAEKIVEFIKKGRLIDVPKIKERVKWNKRK